MASEVSVNADAGGEGGGGSAAPLIAPATHSNNTVSKRFMEGPLSKWTNMVNGWQYRWFVLDQGAGLLSYYTVSSAPRYPG